MDNEIRIEILPPELNDAQDIYRLVCSCNELDKNSSYLYLLLCSHFKDYTLTAKTHDGQLAGFVSAYVIPNSPHTLFIWQVAVKAKYRKYSIGSRLVTQLIGMAIEKGMHRVEATVALSNNASLNMFKRVASAFDCDLTLHKHFTKELFPQDHDEEYLVRIELKRKKENDDENI